MAYKGPTSDRKSAYVCFTLSVARFRSLAYLKNSLRKNTIHLFVLLYSNEVFNVVDITHTCVVCECDNVLGFL